MHNAADCNWQVFVFSSLNYLLNNCDKITLTRYSLIVIINLESHGGTIPDEDNSAGSRRLLYISLSVKVFLHNSWRPDIFLHEIRHRAFRMSLQGQDVLWAIMQVRLNLLTSHTDDPEMQATCTCRDKNKRK